MLRLLPKRGTPLISSNVTFLQTRKFRRYVSLSNIFLYVCKYIPRNEISFEISPEQAKGPRSVGIAAPKSLFGTRDYAAEVLGMTHNTGERLERTYGKPGNKYSGFSISHSYTAHFNKKTNVHIFAAISRFLCGELNVFLLGQRNGKIFSI